MDIFNLKRVEELEREVERLRNVEKENDELRRSLSSAEAQMRGLLGLKDDIPEDCTPGSYCNACEFATHYHYHNWGYYTGRNTTITGIICGKANVCKNFIQKEIKE